MINNLSLKIVGIVFILTSIIFLCLLYLNIRSYSESMLSSFVDRATSAAGSVESNIENMEDAQNKQKLLSSIHKHIWLNPDILEINFNLLQNDKLITYVSSNQNNIDKEVDENNLVAFKKDMVIHATIQKIPKTLRVVTPLHISGKTQGTVQMDFALEHVEAKIQSNIISLVLIFISMMLLFILLLFFFLRLIVIKPIIAINKGVDAISQNNYTYEVNLHSDDEIGRLSQAFAKLVQFLQESQKKIGVYTQELEKKVTERTVALEEAKKQLEKSNISLEEKIKERTVELEKLKNDLEITVAKRTEELHQKLAELERLNSVMTGREIKMIKLKEELEAIKKSNNS